MITDMIISFNRLRVDNVKSETESLVMVTHDQILKTSKMVTRIHQTIEARYAKTYEETVEYVVSGFL